METVVRLDGAVADVLNRLVEFGYFRTRSEALRMGILELGKEFSVLKTPQEIEDELVVQKLNRLEQEAKSGKRKTLSEEEALGKYKKKLGL